MCHAPCEAYRKTHRQRLIAGLRAQGLSFSAIGRRLGISRQAVHACLRRPSAQATFCGRCGAVAIPAGRPTWVVGTGLCPACLSREPGVGFGQVLRACRLAGGLTQAQVARRCGIRATSLCQYERGQHRPRPATVARLARALGPGLLTFHESGKFRQDERA